MDTNLYSPTLDTVDDVRGWISSWKLVGGFPHPDDSAWITCEQEVALGFGESHAKYPSHDEGGHLGIIGPAAPKTKEDALAYDASLDKALAILDAAGVDIYDLILDREEDAVPQVTDILPGTPEWDASEAALVLQRQRGG